MNFFYYCFINLSFWPNAQPPPFYLYLCLYFKYNRSRAESKSCSTACCYGRRPVDRRWQWKVWFKPLNQRSQLGVKVTLTFDLHTGFSACRGSSYVNCGHSASASMGLLFSVEVCSGLWFRIFSLFSFCVFGIYNLKMLPFEMKFFIRMCTLSNWGKWRYGAF